jgi:hypothetical protein
MATSGSKKDQTPSQLIDARIKELGDWRGEMLSRICALIKGTDPEIVEAWKWRGVPTWYDDGILHGRDVQECREDDLGQGSVPGGSFGPLQLQPRGDIRRAIDFHEGETINEKALKTLVRASVILNTSKGKM